MVNSTDPPFFEQVRTPNVSGQNVNSWSMGNPGREPVVVPWTVDCVPVVPVYRSRTLICYIIQCSSPAGEGAHTCLHLLCRIGTTPSISRLVDLSPVQLFPFSCNLSVSSILRLDFPTCLSRHFFLMNEQTLPHSCGL